MTAARYRRAARRDPNEAELVTVIRGLGGTVMHLDDVDLLVGFQGRNYLMEVKQEKAKGLSRHQYDLKPGPQTELHETWRGQICVVRTVEDVCRVLGVKVAG